MLPPAQTVSDGQIMIQRPSVILCDDRGEEKLEVVTGARLKVKKSPQISEILQIRRRGSAAIPDRIVF
jgi:hypothetical protein